MSIDFSRYNERVKGWGKQSVGSMKSEAQGMGIKHNKYAFSSVASRKRVSASPSPDDSVKKLRVGYKSEDGAVSIVSFKVRRSLIYRHAGAGKGMGGTKGSRWTNARGESKSTARKSFGKMGTGSRNAAPFISKVLENETTGVEEVAFIAADELGSAVINGFAQPKK